MYLTSLLVDAWACFADTLILAFLSFCSCVLVSSCCIKLQCIDCIDRAYCKR
jgi:hypothetical protein